MCVIILLSLTRNDNYVGRDVCLHLPLVLTFRNIDPLCVHSDSPLVLPIDPGVQYTDDISRRHVLHCLRVELQNPPQMTVHALWTAELCVQAIIIWPAYDFSILFLSLFMFYFAEHESILLTCPILASSDPSPLNMGHDLDFPSECAACFSFPFLSPTYRCISILQY